MELTGTAHRPWQCSRLRSSPSQRALDRHSRRLQVCAPQGSADMRGSPPRHNVPRQPWSDRQPIPYRTPRPAHPCLNTAPRQDRAYPQPSHCCAASRGACFVPDTEWRSLRCRKQADDVWRALRQQLQSRSLSQGAGWSCLQAAACLSNRSRAAFPFLRTYWQLQVRLLPSSPHSSVWRDESNPSRCGGCRRSDSGCFDRVIPPKVR